MLNLAQAQERFMAAIDNGPAALPSGLFSGPPSRIILGMKAHANTISHARLVALEETFPRTRAAMGDAAFNDRSRQFVGSPEATATALAQIGLGFPSFLARDDQPAAIVELAVFEWAWLSCYHAADIKALNLTDFVGLDTETLLAMVVARHPAASIGLIEDGLKALLETEIPALAAADGAMIARPDTEVLVWPASRPMWWLFAWLDGPASIGNLFALTSEPDRKHQLAPEDFMPALLALIEVGALQRVD